MRHINARPRLARAALAVALAGPLALTGAVFAPSAAQAAVERANCRVHSILASKDEGSARIPAELQFLAEELEKDQFAAYKTFRLLEKKDFDVRLDAFSEGAMKSGHKFRFKLLGAEDNRLKLNLTLHSRQGKSLLNVDYRIDDNGILMVPGGKHSDGTIIFAVQCKSA
jgi:hypothetical protein